MATTAPKKTATAVATTVEGRQLILKFGNGQSLTVDATKLHAEIVQAALMHGLKQKLIDAAAISRDPETGRTATIDDKFNAVRAVYQRITDPNAPSWNAVRVAGEGSSKAKGGMLVAAMMRLTTKSRAEVLEFLETRTKEEVAALRKNPRVEEIMAQLRAEQANTDGIDSDALLDGLMDGAEADDEDGGESDEAVAAPAKPASRRKAG